MSNNSDPQKNVLKEKVRYAATCTIKYFKNLVFNHLCLVKVTREEVKSSTQVCKV